MAQQLMPCFVSPCTPFVEEGIERGGGLAFPRRAIGLGRFDHDVEVSHLAEVIGQQPQLSWKARPPYA